MHPKAQAVDYPPLMTLDTDIAVLSDLAVEGLAIHEQMRTEGFTEELFGDNHPPATHYHLGDEASGFYAEFLTPLRGAYLGRKDVPETTKTVGGIVAQQLLHIELLLDRPWTVEFPGVTQPPLPYWSRTQWRSWRKRSSFTRSVFERTGRRTFCTSTIRSRSSDPNSRKCVDGGGSVGVGGFRSGVP
jgi:hypothetical protein